MDSEVRHLTERERRTLDRSLTFIARAVALAFAGIGLLPTLGLGAVGLYRPEPELVCAGIGIGGAMAAGGFAIGGVLWLLSLPARQALLGGPLKRGEGTVTEVRRRGPDGGSTLVKLAITLPDGREGAGTVRVHTARPHEYTVGERLVLWFPTPPRSFVLDDLSVGHDPGSVSAAPPVDTLGRGATRGRPDP